MGQLSNRFLPRKISKEEIRARKVAMEMIKNSKAIEIDGNDFEKLKCYYLAERSKYIRKAGGLFAMKYIKKILDNYDRDTNKKIII